MTTNNFFENLLDDIKVNTFYKLHQDKCGNHSNYSIKCIGTGIGIKSTMRCDKCGNVVDITNYNHW